MIIKRGVLLILAGICSLLLTVITLSAPPVPYDWARLDPNTHYYAPEPIQANWPSYAVQVGLWVGIVAFSLQPLAFRYNPEKAKPVSFLHSSYIALTAIILIGFGLRLYALDKLPLIVDETGFAAHASDMLHGQQIPIFAPAHNANPATYSWLLAGSMGIFGQTRFAMRLVSLVFGVLTIPAAYQLGKAWWSRRAGLFAAAFVATYPAHIFYSRMALYNIADPLFTLLALTALTRALRQERRRDFVLAGIFAGCAQYFYHGSRLLPVLMLVYIGLAGWHNRDLLRRPYWKLYGLMTLVFALVALPRFAPLLVGQLPITGNIDPLHLPADLIANSIRSILAWVGQPDISPFWLSSAPLIPWLALVMTVIGLFMCLRKPTDPRRALPILSVGLTTIFGGMIWTAAPLYVRYLTALPLIAMLVVMGIKEFARQANWLVVLIIGVIGLQGVWLSFQQVDEAVSRITPAHWEADALAQTAATLPLDTPVIVREGEDWSDTEWITFAHLVAAYGQRRTIIRTQQPLPP